MVIQQFKLHQPELSEDLKQALTVELVESLAKASPFLVSQGKPRPRRRFSAPIKSSDVLFLFRRWTRVEIPQLKGNPYQSEGFKEKDVNSFESTFNLEKAKLIRTGMWLLVLAHVFNCFIVGTWIYQLITATSKLTAIDNAVAGLGLRLPAKITIVSIIFIPLALCLGTIGHILWLRAGSLIESRNKIGWSLGLWFASFLLPTIYLFAILPVLLAASAKVGALSHGLGNSNPA